MAKYFIKRNDKINGPFTSGQIAGGIESLELVATDLFSVSREGPWKAIADFSENATADPATIKAEMTGSSSSYGNQKHSPPSLSNANREAGDATGGVIPYENLPALRAYYLGIVSLLLPLLGIVFTFWLGFSFNWFSSAKTFAYFYFIVSLLFSCISLFLAITALTLGVMGLQKQKKNPIVKGSVHAWFGIAVGGLFTLWWVYNIVTKVIELVFSSP